MSFSASELVEGAETFDAVEFLGFPVDGFLDHLQAIGGRFQEQTLGARPQIHLHGRRVSNCRRWAATNLPRQFARLPYPMTRVPGSVSKSLGQHPRQTSDRLVAIPVRGEWQASLEMNRPLRSRGICITEFVLFQVAGSRHARRVRLHAGRLFAGVFSQLEL